jgi:hypothetical protein
MTSDDAHDAGADGGRLRLMALAPDPDRAERVRARCRTQLGRSQRRKARRAAIAGFAWEVLAPGVVAGFCVLYAALLAATTLRLQGLFP